MLADKVQDNPEIEKLFGAPHIYMWNSQVLEAGNIRWKKMKNKLIQKKEYKERNTAFFPDPTLYEQATISNKKGVKIGGGNGVPPFLFQA